jgi:tRNA G26 N,N-dimethylase Trm1
METQYQDIKHVLVFKTNLHFKDMKQIEPVLNAEIMIIKWNVDLTDIDNVLRIESNQPHTAHVIATLKKHGFYCEELVD